jgi:DNA-binding transcriptional ArsR family regulator
MTTRTNEKVNIGWDCGTVYDFFFSLYVLHRPEDFGLRGAWAAGVRSRLVPEERKVLEEAQDVIFTPHAFLFDLPQPKDARTALQVLESMPARERLPVLTFSWSRSKEARETLQEIAARGRWTAEDRKVLKEEFRHSNRRIHNLENMLNWWANIEDYGEVYLQALLSYYHGFFSEEERRIQPFLRNAVEAGKERAKELSWQELVEELSQGIRLDSLTDLSEIILVPSYWSTPLIVYDRINEQGRYLVLFGARPADLSLVPGEVVPDALLRSLKALADPTRLRILRYLSEETLTPSQLARLLRLRAPTVTHHLSALRLAGLVRLTLEKERENRYEVRGEIVKGAFASLQKFLEGKDQTSQ